MSFIIDDLKLDEYEYEVYLCKPSYPYDIIKSLTNCIDNRNFKWILRQPDEFSFKIYDTFEDGSVNDAYNDIVNASVIMVERLIDKVIDKTMLFHISEVNPISDMTNCKEVKAYSLEVRMNKQSVKDFEFSTNLYTGTCDIDDLPNSGIVDYILTLFNGNWSVGYISNNINGVGKQRKFNIKDARVLDAIKIIEDNYNCIFIFRTDVQEIDIVEHGDGYMGMFTNNGLILDDNNYIQQYNSQINVDNVVTRLYIEGANNSSIKSIKYNSSINSINILGTKYIDDFSFFMNTDYMSQGLIDALNSLISLRASQQSNYNSESSNLNTATGNLIDLKDELSILKGELIILEDRQDMAIRTGMLIKGFNYEHWKTQGDNKQSEIDTKNIEITNKESEINGIINNLNAISTLVSYETNLTSIQLKELTNFIQEGKVKFETDVPSELLELGQAYLNTFYGLQFDIKVDLFDLFSNKDVSYDWDKIELGRKVNLILDKNKTIYEPIIVSLEHSPDSNRLGMTVSNKAYLNDDLNYITSLYAKFGTTSTIVDKDKDKWDDALDSEEFEQYKSSDINANERNIILTDEESLVQQAQITRRGIFMREGQNDVGQMRIFSDRIVFSRTNWNPVGAYTGYSVAITSLGIQTSEEFVFATEGTHTVGGETFNLVRINGNGMKIYGDGTETSGIEIYNQNNQKVIGFDSAGNMTMTGNITMQGGSINWDEVNSDPDITTAQTDANTANALLSDIADDDKLTPNEKQMVKKEWDIIVAEYPTLITQATEYVVSATPYTTAYNTLNSYITPLLSNLNTTSNIIGDTFRTNFKNYYDEKIKLLKVLSDDNRAITQAIANGTYEGGTFIDGNQIFSPTILNNKAGMTDEGEIDGSIRIWAGASYENRGSASFFVTQGGQFFAGDFASSKYILWDSINLTVRGSLTANDITAGTLSTSNWTGTGNDHIVMRRQMMYFRENTLDKMAIGFLPSHQNPSVQIPLLVLGAGDGNGNNRGYIAKGTNSLDMYYIGNLGSGEVSGFKLYKDKIETTHPIIVNAGLVGEFILNATNWNAKLEEASAKAIVENPAKAWNIPKQNLRGTDVAPWDVAGGQFSLIGGAYSLTSKVKPSSAWGNPDSNGLYYGSDYIGFYHTVNGWSSFIKSDGQFKFRGNANNFIEWNGSSLNIKGGIVVDGSVVGSRFYGDTTSSGYMKIGTRGGNWGDMTIYRGGTTTPIINFYDDAGVMHLIPYGTDGSISGRILSMFNGTAEPRGNWNFSNATVSGLQVKFS